MRILDVPQSGKRGQSVAFQSRFGLCLRGYVVPKNNRTPACDHMRRVFGGNSRMWSAALTEAQRNRWCAAGGKVMSHPRLGQKGPLTGQQFWQAINSVRGCVGLPATYDPPAPVIFGASQAGPLIIENTADGVRLYLAVSGELETDIMVFGQEPCSAGRRKRRNVAYLGLLPPPIARRSEITSLYKAKYGEPRAGSKVFIVTCQTKDGWKDSDREASEVVPDPPIALQAISDTVSSQNRYMHKGGTRDVTGIAATPCLECPESPNTPEIGGIAAKSDSEGAREPGNEGDSPG